MVKNYRITTKVLLAIILCTITAVFPVCALADMEISFFGVAQGNAVLIQSDSNTMLIDAGTNETFALMQNYLTANEIKKIDMLLLNQNADTIDRLDTIATSYDIGTIMIPNLINSVPTLDDVLSTININGIPITSPQAGDIFKLGEAVITILSPTIDSMSELGNYQIAMRIEYGERSFLFPGAMEEHTLNKILLSESPIKTDVLMLPHHSSATSAIHDFIKAVSPKYAIISCDSEGEQSFSSNELLAVLVEFGISVYRTDANGTIIIKTDGESLDISTTKDAQPSESALDISFAYIGNKKSKKFHLPTCSSLPAEKNQVKLESREKAIKKGYTPCKRCNP